MADTLFPVFDVPEIETPAAGSERRYRPSVFFDYEEGDFRRNGTGNMVPSTGQEAFIHWCLKVCMTERFTRLSYSTDIGTEMIGALSQADREAVESAIERTITEALMVNPKTEYVRGFTYEYDADDLRVSFIVKGREWEETPLTVTYNQ